MGKHKVELNNGTYEIYPTLEEVRMGILESHSEGVGVYWIESEDGTIYSCIWSVELQQ